MSKLPTEPVSAEVLKTLTERQQQEQQQSGGVGNLLVAIDKSVAGAIAEKEVERDDLVRRVLELNAAIVRLRTHQLVGSEVSNPE